MIEIDGMPLGEWLAQFCPVVIHDSEEIAERVRCTRPLDAGVCPEHGKVRPERGEAAP